MGVDCHWNTELQVEGNRGVFPESMSCNSFGRSFCLLLLASFISVSLSPGPNLASSGQGRIFYLIKI